MRVPRRSQPGSYPLVPDYIGFLGFAFAALDTAATRWADATQVDFLVERKQHVTHNVPEFLASLTGALEYKGRTHTLIGEAAHRRQARP